MQLYTHVGKVPQEESEFSTQKTSTGPSWICLCMLLSFQCAVKASGRGQQSISMQLHLQAADWVAGFTCLDGGVGSSC